jgi:hypothetical protein
MSCVDVIVPCYRYGHFLRQCVESVLAQAGVDVRVLIIDDCSPDDTQAIGTQLSHRYAQVTFLRHAVNRGHIATYNEGIEWVSSKYYLLLSADDYLLPGALGRTVRFMDAHESVGLAYGKAITLNHGELPPAVPRQEAADWRMLSGLKFMKMSGARNCVPTPAAVVRTEVQKRIGGYRPELPHSGDLEMWFRLAAHADVGISESEHAVYRRHAGNMSLAYTTRSWLPDVQQRKAAFDSFLRSCKAIFPQAEEVYRHSLRLLAEEAVGFASSAFNDGDMETSRQLSQLALELSPGVRWSGRWAKLACKRRLGLGAWRSIRAIRQIVNLG